ncbi:substrate-binding periplasmic protein [Leptolyngbya sp. PCC 6406]|uniref:substrate-binding periplasmic protein n=1 Tax=Leptolyngbya sp. PCC 6406 TaxID=1173264 RepID=UPI0002ACA4B1|nr:ABC transporter substrate-binding protein [Leptolyngbya sp. PCC 6406]
MSYLLSVPTAVESITVEPGQLRIVTSAIEARPMSFVDGGEWMGYEPAVARAVCKRLNLEPVWCALPLQKLYLELSKGQHDVVWFNQAITQERRAWADFTRPYGRFDTAVLVREESPITRKEDLSGRQLGILSGSTSHTLAEVFPPDVVMVPFSCDDPIPETLLNALRQGRIDAIMEDELVLMAAEAQDTSLRVAFQIPTQRPFGVGVLPGNRELLEALNDTLNGLIADGTLAKLWAQWIPYRSYPF